MGFAVGEAIQEDENASAFEQELKKIERQWRRLRWVLLAIAVYIACYCSNLSPSYIFSGSP